MPGERSGAAIVISQEGSEVRVEHRGTRLVAAMRGFPTGFMLTPGSRVILADEPSGLVARPLVRTVTVNIKRSVVDAGGTLEIEGHRVEIQKGTIVDSGPRLGEARPSDTYTMWIVEGGPTEQAIAVRRLR